MELTPNLLNDVQLSDAQSPIGSDSDIRGFYNHLVYILRLHPDVHQILNKVESGEPTNDLMPGEIYQATSTLFHENLHWWQFVGSTSGLIMSLSLPAQITSNLKFFKDYLALSGKKKPITTYSDNCHRPDDTDDPEFRAINQILNTFHDIHFYKVRTKRPKKITECYKSKYFESVGHSFNITYASSLGLIATTFDPDYSFLPNPAAWQDEFRRLADEKVSGFYYGEKSIGIPPIGTADLYEGQARFNQMLYLHTVSNKTLDWFQFRQVGMLHGLYESAFTLFLKILEEECPKSVDSPLVALYLLLIDIAINPAEGFPFDIVEYEEFVNATDPGIRFVYLCNAVKHEYPEFKGLITEYSSEEYWVISTVLCEAIGVIPPIIYLEKFSSWCDNEESIIKLMEDNEKFNFEPGNLLVRLILARFLSFQQDKLKNPEFFCWPGIYLEGERRNTTTDHFYLKHQALFKENLNMDIAPSMLPGIDEKTLEDTAGEFYLAVVLFELCQQWILEPGDFEYNFQWLSKYYSSEDLESWAKNAFITTFGVSPDDFEIVTPKASS